MRGITTLATVTCLLFSAVNALPAHPTNLVMRRADDSSHGNLVQLGGFSKDGAKWPAPVSGSGEAGNAKMGAKSAR
ncbi:hypothetical protein LA080_005578 [Diaporthe eres]|nr:hypothetical protein LA080_005578 [Diaporthe eres]